MKKVHIVYILMLFSYLFVSCEKETAEIVIVNEEFPPTTDLITVDLKINVNDVDDVLDEEVNINFLHAGIEISNDITIDGKVDLKEQPVHANSTLIKISSNKYLPNYLSREFQENSAYIFDMEVKEIAEVVTISNNEVNEYKTSSNINVNVNKEAVDFSGAEFIIRSGKIEKNELSNLFPINNSVSKNNVESTLDLTTVFYVDFTTTAFDPIELVDGKSIKYEINNTFNLLNEYQLWYFEEGSALWNEIDYVNLTSEVLTFEFTETGYFAFSIVSSCDDDQIPPIAVCDQNVIYDYDQNGDGFIYALGLDDGSHDDCTLNLEYFVKKFNDTCGDGSDQFSEKIGICSSDVGTDFLVTLKITDEAGNSNSCVIKIKVNGIPCVNDALQPVAICESDFTYNYSTLGDSFITADEIDDGSFDNCPAPLLMEIKKSVDTCGDGSDTFSEKVSVCAADVSTPFFVVLQVTDGAGNLTQCATNVTVIGSNCSNDQVPPTPVVEIEVEVSFATATEIFASDLNDGSNDNCTTSDNLDYKLVKLDDVCGTSSGAYTSSIDLCAAEINTEFTVAIQVTDESGNTNLAYTMIKVIN